MKAYYADQFVLPLPAGHRFPMVKYSLLRERLVSEGVLRPEELVVPEAASREDLLRVHAGHYVDAVFEGTLVPSEVRRLGFPWSPQLVERSRRSVGGTLAACRTALVEGVGANLAGGTHHAFADRGEGYCVFNDAAVAARALQAHGEVGDVVIIDCDVHQGNGTAAIFRNDPSVLTYSIHGERNFPFRKEVSDVDVPLPDGTADEQYLAALESTLLPLLERGAPTLAIYVSGADPWREDRLGRLRLSKHGLSRRDRFVVEACRSRGIPVALTMAGGYAANIDDTVDIHVGTVAIAAGRPRRVAADLSHATFLPVG